MIFILLLILSTKNARAIQIRINVEMILISTCCFWLTVIFVTGLVLGDPRYKKATLITVGSACASCDVLFYTAPLLHLYEIIQTKDSSSLYYPALVVNGLSCSLWAIYGLFGVYDIAVFLPSLIGLSVVIIGLRMCCMYPAIEPDQGSTKESSHPYAVYANSRQMSMRNSRQLSLISLMSGKSRMGSGIPHSNRVHSNRIRNDNMRISVEFQSARRQMSIDSDCDVSSNRISNNNFTNVKRKMSLERVQSSIDVINAKRKMSLDFMNNNNIAMEKNLSLKKSPLDYTDDYYVPQYSIKAKKIGSAVMLKDIEENPGDSMMMDIEDLDGDSSEHNSSSPKISTSLLS